MVWVTLPLLELLFAAKNKMELGSKAVILMATLLAWRSALITFWICDVSLILLRKLLNITNHSIVVIDACAHLKSLQSNYSLLIDFSKKAKKASSYVICLFGLKQFKWHSTCLSEKLIKQMNHIFITKILWAIYGELAIQAWFLHLPKTWTNIEAISVQQTSKVSYCDLLYCFKMSAESESSILFSQLI